MADIDPPMFEVYRRPRGSRNRWEKIPDLGPMTKDVAFKATVAEEWKASFTVWEYAVAPVGQTPNERRNEMGGRRGTFHEGYRTKVMKPR